MTLTLGHITYLNCVPFFHHLRAQGFTGDIIGGVPSHLNQLLAQGLVDVSPSSSFEYGLHWRQYLLLPGFSISSRGPVKSVLLFSRHELHELGGEPIALTAESATSINLLRVLLHEFVGVHTHNVFTPENPVEQCLAGGASALLIGDRALRAAQHPPTGCRVYDLGELWQQHTGLPFVFALWIVRRDAAERHRRQLHQLAEALQGSLQTALADLHALARATPEHDWMGVDGLADYWRSMSFALDEQHLQGLRLYFRLCCKWGLLSEEAPLEFFLWE